MCHNGNLQGELNLKAVAVQQYSLCNFFKLWARTFRSSSHAAPPAYFYNAVSWYCEICQSFDDTSIKREINTVLQYTAEGSISVFCI